MSTKRSCLNVPIKNSPPSPPAGPRVLSGKKPQKFGNTSDLRDRVKEVIVAEAAHAGEACPGPNSMRRLSESDKDREAFYIWAFEQNPQLLLLLNRFLSYGWRGSDALGTLTEILRDASGLAHRSAEDKQQFLKTRFR